MGEQGVLPRERGKVDGGIRQEDCSGLGGLLQPSGASTSTSKEEADAKACLEHPSTRRGCSSGLPTVILPGPSTHEEEGARKLVLSTVAKASDVDALSVLLLAPRILERSP